MPTCPYHGNDAPCKECWTKRMGVFSDPRYNPRPGECPFHGGKYPCFECYKQNMGEFAHAYRPPVHYQPEHIRLPQRDQCGIACCAMAGQYFRSQFTIDSLSKFMVDKGIYVPKSESFFHALNQALEWLGLSCQQCTGRPADFAHDLQNNCILILEGKGHVVVIFAINGDGTLIVGDPDMFKLEPSVDPNDYRLQGTGRIWKIWKQ